MPSWFVINKQYILSEKNSVQHIVNNDTWVNNNNEIFHFFLKVYVHVLKGCGNVSYLLNKILKD